MVPGGHLQAKLPRPLLWHTPLFRHGLGLHASQIWHRSPWKPFLHEQRIELPSERHVPPFAHGLGAHRSPTGHRKQTQTQETVGLLEFD